MVPGKCFCHRLLLELLLYSPLVQVIKSARVMKKAVAHLIPFMEVLDIIL